MTQDTAPGSASPAARRFGQVMLLVPGTIALVHAMIALARAATGPAVMVGVLTVAIVALLYRALARATPGPIHLSIGLLCAQQAILLATLNDAVVVPCRWWHLATLLATGGTLTAATLGYRRIVTSDRALLAGYGIGGALLVADTIVSLTAGMPRPGITVPAGLDSLLHLERGGVPALVPGADLELRRTDNPDGYFRSVDLRPRLWQLAVHQDDSATLGFPAESGTALRVEIQRLTPGPSWHVQLAQPGLAVRSLGAYTVELRARADSTRTMAVAFTQAEPPWGIVGFYEEMRLDTAWTTFRASFIAGRDDDNVRVHFDLAGAESAVEIADVVIRDDDRGATLEPPVDDRRHQVRHAINSLGCRDGELTERAAGASRVLVVGGSAAMGLWVHRDDTFAERIQAAGEGRLDVVNCAVPGLGSREAARRGADLLPRVDADQLVLLLDADAATPLREDAARQALLGSPPPARLSAAWSRVVVARARDAIDPVATASADIADLQAQVRAAGATLTVVLVQLTSEDITAAITEQVRTANLGMTVLLIDLRDVIGDHDPGTFWERGGQTAARAHAVIATALGPHLAGAAP